FGPVSTNASPAPRRKDRPAKTSRPPRKQARHLAVSSVSDIVKPVSYRPACRAGTRARLIRSENKFGQIVLVLDVRPNFKALTLVRTSIERTATLSLRQDI